jgi:hypothetical protein
MRRNAKITLPRWEGSRSTPLLGSLIDDGSMAPLHGEAKTVGNTWVAQGGSVRLPSSGHSKKRRLTRSRTGYLSSRATITMALALDKLTSGGPPSEGIGSARGRGGGPGLDKGDSDRPLLRATAIGLHEAAHDDAPIHPLRSGINPAASRPVGDQDRARQR